MRRTWRTQQRRLIAGTVGLAMGIICLADRADSQAMTEVTFVVVNNLFSTPAFVAVENGYWTKQGLNVKIKLTSSGRQVTQSLQAGEAQFGHAALSTTTASARASGNMLKGVMPYYNAGDHIAKAGGRAIIARKDRGIDAGNPKSMEGKKIGYLKGSTNDVYLRAMVQARASSTSPNPSSSTCRSRTCRSRWCRARSTRSCRGSPTPRRRCASSAPTPPWSAAARRASWRTSSAWSRTRIGSARTTTCMEKFSIGIAQAAQFIRQNPKGAAEIDDPLSRRPQRRRRDRRA